ncbi:hypothetical protein BH09PLA1_BH09PLA1_27700 [soil metagenome]
MHALPHDLRLLITVLLNAIVLASSVRFVRRRHIVEWPQVALDAMLFWYLVQYLSIALPGAFGCLNVGTMMLTAGALSAAMIFAPVSRTRPDEPPPTIGALDRRIVFACLGLLTALVAGNVYNQRIAPPTVNDALTYHLPAAVQWLQTGRIGLFETWFFNPANTYSPLAGSTFIAWLIAPTGGDILARAVEAPALLMIFFVLLQLARALGASVRVAAIVALAGCCSRPLISQVFLAKDDLFVATFFGATIVALIKPRLRDSLGAARLGIALGLLLATKYTALLALPILLLTLDAPHRAGWRARQTVPAIGIARLLAGRWYLRNWIVAGNPFFPIDVKLGPLTLFTGLFAPARSQSLQSLAGIWKTFTGYYGLPMLPLSALALVWIATVFRAGARLKHDPLIRIIALGPPVSIALFIATSPYAEVRFIYPAFVLLFAAAAIAVQWMRSESAQMAGAIVLACCTIGTSFIPQSLAAMVLPAICALAVFALIALAIELRSLALTAFILVAAAALAYVYWPQYVNQCRDEATLYWSMPYGSLGEAWKFIRDDTPPGSTIAYSNTHFVYPLMGRDLDRRIVYAPTRAGLRSIAELGHVDGALPGEQIAAAITHGIFREPDRNVWLGNLRRSDAKFLIVGHADPETAPPPELEFARQNAEFQLVFENSAATIYEFAPAGP